MTRKFPWTAVPAYVVAQFAGGIIASLAVSAKCCSKESCGSRVPSTALIPPEARTVCASRRPRFPITRQSTPRRWASIAARIPAVSLDAITGREREVLALIATGLSNPEIAARLSISEATAKTHVGHLLTKLNARDRVHLVILAFQAGLVTTG